MTLNYDPRLVIEALEKEYKQIFNKKKATQEDITRARRILEKWKVLTNFKNEDDEEGL